MSLLPQHKKSAEEIAKLRESLGIPGLPPGEEELPVEAPLPTPVDRMGAAEGAATELPPELAVAPLVHPPKEVRSLKRSERIPILAADGDAPVHPEPMKLPANSALPVAREPKVVHSLRKSEQGPIPAAPRPHTSSDSKLPAHRHSDREISEIRRQEAIGMMASAPHPRSLAARPVLVIPGYLFAAAGAVCFYFYDVALPITAGCVVAALLIAVFVFIRKPLSRHHAAFIAVASLFVVVFGTLHYFPQIQHGT